jgi:MSHA pilin protein MshA
MYQGFTLIELAVVVSIVAITIAVMLPRVWYWQREARVGNLNGTRGAVQSAATLVHAALLSRRGEADAEPCAAGTAAATNRLEGWGTLCTESGLVQIRNGYPASVPFGDVPPGILGVAGVGPAFHSSREQLLSQGFEVRVDGPVTTISRADAPTPAQCSFTYTESLVARTAASISPSLTSGC